MDDLIQVGDNDTYWWLNQGIAGIASWIDAIVSYGVIPESQDRIAIHAASQVEQLGSPIRSRVCHKSSVGWWFSDEVGFWEVRTSGGGLVFHMKSKAKAQV